MNMMLKILILLFLAGQCPLVAEAWYPRLDEDSFLEDLNPAPLVGRNRRYMLAPGETLIEMARRSGTGYQSLAQANPGIDPWLPPDGAEVDLPYAFILPKGAEEGITINLAEFRLYFIWQENGRKKIRAYPIGIGQEGAETPTGRFTIVCKVKNPTWFPPAKIRKRSPELPLSVPPGPSNPLGEYWLGLSIEGYGIHGTVKPFGVGRRVSQGCLRLYPEDIRDLFQKVNAGTRVTIIHQPIKVGLKDERLFLEVHPSLGGSKDEDPLTEISRLVAVLPWQGQLNMQEVHQAIQEQRGVPVLISSP